MPFSQVFSILAIRAISLQSSAFQYITLSNSCFVVVSPKAFERQNLHCFCHSTTTVANAVSADPSGKMMNKPTEDGWSSNSVQAVVFIEIYDSKAPGLLSTKLLRKRKEL